MKGRVLMPSIFARLKRAYLTSPADKYAAAFEIASLAGNLILSTPVIGSLLRRIGHFIRFILVIITPAIPIDTKEATSLSQDPIEFYKRIWLFTYPLTVLFCLGFNAALSFVSGTFMPTGRVDSIPFIYDTWNIFLYTIICPMYVSAAFCLIATTVMSWNRLNAHTAPIETTAHRLQVSNSTRIATFLATSFIIASLFIANYIDDLSNKDKTKEIYWFFSEAASKERILNKAGSYYLFLNAALLYITVIAALCYVAMAIEMFRLGANIERSKFASIIQPKTTRDFSVQEAALRQELVDFTYCYIWAKLLVLVYAGNILVWHRSPAGVGSNVEVAILALVLIGLVFLILPNYYFGSKWHHFKLKNTSQSATAAEPPDDYTDIRSKHIKRTAAFIDVAFYILLAYIFRERYDAETHLEKVRAMIDVIIKWLTPFVFW